MKFTNKYLLSMCLLLIGQLTWAAQVKVIPNNQKALQTRVDLIKLAKEEILIEYFEVADDLVSNTGLALLQEAAEKRNVKVKILLDDMHSEITRPQFAAILRNLKPLERSKNIEIKVFNPLNILKPFDQTYRNHDKLFVVDGKYAIIGGRNVSGSYFGRAENGKANLRDVDVLIAGEEVKAAKDYFINLWDRNKHVKERPLYEFSVDNLSAICGFKAPDNVEGCERAKEYAVSQVNVAQARFDSIVKAINLNLGSFSIKGEISKDLFANMHEVDVQFMFNNPEKVMKKVSEKLSSQLYSEIASIRPQSISIVTPYLFPHKDTLDLFEGLIKEQGTKIKIATNSLRSTDSALVHAAYLSVQPRMINMGIDLFEYNGPETDQDKNNPEILHAKLMILNEESESPILFIGSFNLDHRSAFINRELGVKIFGKEVKAVQKEMTAQVLDITSSSTQVSENGRKLEQNVRALDAKTDPAKKEQAEAMKIWVKLLPKQI